jgi:oligopeptide transport system permease protein
VTAKPPVPRADAGTSLWKDAMRRLRRNRLAVAGAAFLVLLVLACFLGPLLLTHGADDQVTQRRDQSPSWEHPFGTDGLGRDYLARVLEGGQISLLVGLVGTLVVVVVGTLWGATAGYYGGKVDEVMMRFVDFMYGIPYMLLVVLFLLLLPDEFRGQNPAPLFAALGLVQWLGLSRIVRGQVLAIKHREYVHAARVMGATRESSSDTFCPTAWVRSSSSPH